MIKISQFEKNIQKEISNLVNVSVKYKDIQIVSNEKYENKKRITVYQMKFNSLIITAPSLYNSIKDVVSSMGEKSKIYIDQLKNLLNLNDHKVTNKTIYLFLNPIDFKDSFLESRYKLSRLNEGYNTEFEKFKSEDKKKDLDEALVSLEDPVVYGCFFKDKLIGVTSYWFWEERIADIGVVVHPKYRQQGVGQVLVAKLCKWGIDHNIINLYRHDETNKNSSLLAVSLNMKEHFFVEEISL